MGRPPKVKVTTSPKKTKSPVKRQKRAKKDPNAPKRGKSAYMFWLAENRSRLTKPGMSVVDVTKAAGEEWGKIKPDEKAKYEKLAAEDKKRYEREIKSYRSELESSKESPKKGRGKGRKQ